MRHLKEEEIFEYRTGIAGGLKRFLQKRHIAKCDKCKGMLEAEEKMAKAFQSRLSKDLGRFEPSQMMDARVKKAIEEIAPTMPTPLAWFFRKALAAGLTVALVASVYSVFFFVPLMGSAKETPAQAVYSGMMSPVISKAKNLIPQSLYSKSQDIDKYIFLNIWCNTYNICEADRLRLIQLEGHNYSDVFIASLIGQIYTKPVDKILPMIEKGMTPGQIASQLDIPFTSQIGSVSQASELVDRTKEDIQNNKTTIIPVKKENGKIITPVALDAESQKKIMNQPDGVYDATVNRDSKVEKVTSVPSGYGFHNGIISNVDYEKELVFIKTDNGQIIVKAAYETSTTRYGQSIMFNQLKTGQTAQVNAVKVDGLFVAKLIDVSDPDVTINTSGEIVAFEDKSIAIRGFGAELFIGASTVVNGKIERGSTAKLTAIGNDSKGYTIKTITITKPVVSIAKEKLETVEGIIVALESDDSGRKFMLLSDGMMISYSRFTKVQGQQLAIGLKISSLGVMEGEHNQDARVMNVTETAASEGFEIAGELDDLRCLNNCSWVDAKGVSEVILKGNGTQYIIYPKTVNHLKLNLAKKGQTVIFEGHTVEGIKLVDKAEVVEPHTQFIHKGEIVSNNNGLVTLDDQTEIKIKSYTKNGKDAQVGKTASILCFKSSAGLVALEITAEDNTEIVATGWTKITSFDGAMLTLEDGTKLSVTDSTVIVTGYLQEKSDKTALLPGLKVSCTYIKGSSNKAVKIMVFEG